VQLNGVTAIVTGGASGLGRAAAEELHRRAARVVVVDLPSAKDRLGGDDRFVFAPADVRDPAGVQAAVDLAQEFGDLRVCVNCAGAAIAGRTVGPNGPLPLEDFRAVIEINLVGTFNVLRLAAAAMVQNDPRNGERGVIINTASVAAFEGQIGQISYAAAKGGIASMTLPVARDLARSLIRCVTIAPGLFDTPLFATISREHRDALAASVPHPQRLGSPAEFAALARHIVENPMLNGEVIRLDGAIRMAPR
jgi:NAD(P)-dependent dehydrogenase (short-subunit alcohol dehydrogenase family)